MKSIQGRDAAVVERHAAAHREPTAQRRRMPSGTGDGGRRAGVLGGITPTSPRLQSFQTMQAMADARMHAPTMQRVAIDEEEAPLQGRFGSAPKRSATAQRSEAAEPTPHRTGLPDALKRGIEALSGLSMDGVRVHYGSSRPAQLQAHAYAQGSDIHVAPGQERHLPHEAWHVVQQAQGRVSTRTQAQGMSLNADPALEAEADLMGARALATGAEGTQRAPLRKVEADGEAVQRKVGFEFEIGQIETTRRWLSFSKWSPHVKLNKADRLLTGRGFTVEADETATGSDLEFVTEAFPVTVAGFQALTDALNHIADIAGYIINQPNVRQNSRFMPHGTPTPNRYARYLGGDSRGKPQATIGVSLTALDRLFTEMAPVPDAAGRATPTQELFGGGLDPAGSGASMGGTRDVTGIKQIGAARAAAHAEAVSVARALPPGVATPELDALVTQLVLYLVTGFDGVQGYGKTIAAPMTMMRTAFDTVFQTLPAAPRHHFEANPAAFVSLVCGAARRLRPAIANDGSVFEGGIYRHAMYTRRGPARKLVAKQQMLTRHLKRNDWLLGIVAGIDLLTANFFPAGQAERQEIESLGGYGAKTDQMPGGARLPILELRGLPKILPGLFPLMALDIFRYVYALNNAAEDGNPGYLQNVSIDARVKMAQDDPDYGRAYRQNAIHAARLAVKAWGVGASGG